jgi:hypothetical protein
MAAEPLPPFPVSTVHERGALDGQLAQLTPAERANAQLVVAVGNVAQEVRDEARSIERLWNAGEYDVAQARLRELGNRVDPASILVGVNWRNPRPGPERLNWNGNVQVSGRDSIWRYVLDYHNADGKLVVGAIRLRGTYTGFDFYLSTDNGSTWLETFDGAWSGANVIGDLSGRCHGGHMYFGYLHPANPESLLVMRFKLLDGSYDTFANGAYVVGAVGGAAGDTVVKGAVTSFDDEYPGMRVYAFAGTRQHNVVGAWSDLDAVTWHPWNTGYLAGSYSGSLSASVNSGYSDRYVWFTYDYAPTDTTHYPLVAWVWVGDSVRGIYINLASRAIYWGSTAVRHDSMVMAYEHQNRASGHYPRAIQTPNNGQSWYWAYIPNDSALYREEPNISARRWSALAAVYRERNPNNSRRISFTTSTLWAYPWATPDSINDQTPWIVYPAQVVPLSQGLYGATYISYPYANLWYNRSDFGTAIAENPEPAKVRAAVQALPIPGGARLTFNNPVAGEVRLQVYDANGRLVTGSSRLSGPGPQVWDYQAPASGVYFVSLEGTQHLGEAKLTIVK